MSEKSGFDELLEKLKEEHPAFYKYNQIYADETTKIHESLFAVSGATGPVPEIERYNARVLEVEEDVAKREEEMLKNYWGVS